MGLITLVNTDETRVSTEIKEHECYEESCPCLMDAIRKLWDSVGNPKHFTIVTSVGKIDF